MKAVLFDRFGPPEVLRFTDVADPVAGPREVVIRVHAVSVNRTLDLTVREGRYSRQIQLPHILGTDPVGVVAVVGSDVTERKPGDRVATSSAVRLATATEPPLMLGVNVWGGYAELVKVPVEATYLVPDDLTFPIACVVARHAPTAFHLLRDRAKLKDGEWVLVMGAAGGLGSAGVQVAKFLGAKVIAGAGSAERAGLAKRLGADFAVNYRSEDLEAAVLQITAGRGVNVVFENIGEPELFTKAINSLGRFGRLVTAGAHGGGVVPLDIRKLYLNQLSVFGATGQVPADVEICLRAAADGRFVATIDRVLPLRDAALAHELLASRQELGKILLSPDLQ
jgi:NADPH:quinone reductase